MEGDIVHVTLSSIIRDGHFNSQILNDKIKSKKTQILGLQGFLIPTRIMGIKGTLNVILRDPCLLKRHVRFTIRYPYR